MAYRIIDTLINDQQKTLLLDKGEDLTCYRLLTDREYLDGKVWKSQNERTPSDAKIRRWRFGKADPEKKNKTILMVGETGTGKTTLINTMVNYMLGVKPEDKMWFEITEEEKTNQAKSQTSAITLYEIHIDNPISFSIIDTPGYGATDGIEQDKQVAEHLLTLFTCYEGVQRISSVGLVVKASQNRLTESQKYIFDAVLSLFGKNLEENIVIFITHAHPCYPEDALNAIKEAQIPCAKGEDDDPLFYLFNNDFAKKEKNKGKYKHKTKNEDTNWSMGENSMTEFFEFLNNIEEKSLRMTEDVLKQRKALEACVMNLKHRICLEEDEQEKLESIKAAILANKEKLDNNENFEIEVKETITTIVRIKEQLNCNEEATRCTKCKKNCHFPGCTWVDENKLWRCSVMKNEKCTMCSQKCSYTDHVKDGNMYINATQTVKKTAERLKKDYEEKYGKGVDMQARIEENLLQSKTQRMKLVDEAYEHIMKLQEIALKKDAQFVAVAVEFLITRLNETGQNEKARNLEEIKMRIPPDDTGIKALYKSIFSFVKKIA